MTQYILGIKPDYEGLLINPCIPKKWDGFKMKRKFRGAIYLIEVKNPEHVSKGVKHITVNSTSIEGKLVPILEVGKEHIIEVMMG